MKSFERITQKANRLKRIPKKNQSWYIIIEIKMNESTSENSMFKWEINQMNGQMNTNWTPIKCTTIRFTFHSIANDLIFSILYNYTRNASNNKWNQNVFLPKYSVILGQIQQNFEYQPVKINSPDKRTNLQFALFSCKWIISKLAIKLYSPLL